MSNFIHPTAIVDRTVVLGENNFIGPYCVIQGDVRIGNNNRFEGFCSIGSPAEHRLHFTDFGPVVIGDNNTFREFVTVNGGTVRNTVIGFRNIFLTKSHIGHDSILEDDVTVSVGAVIGGHSHLMKGCNIALNAATHQFSVIGSYAMVGMGGIVTKKSFVKPGEIHAGNPVRFLRTNEIGLERNGVTEEALQQETIRFIELVKSNH